MDIAMQAARHESSVLQPIPALEIPDFNYEMARIFHHYFSWYRPKLSPDLSLTRTADYEIVEFILQEYSKDLINIPLTYEQEEEKSFQIKLIKFLISPEGQHFFSSIYAHLFEDPGKLKPEYQAFIILYWKYKKYWKQKLKTEQAPIADITRFLSKHYMEYWRKQISAQTQIVSNGGNEVYSIFLADKPTTNDSGNNPTDSEIDAEVLQEFYRFITPPKKQVINSPPLAPNKHNRIRHGIITSASLDPLWPHNDDYTPPPLPSPSPNIT